MAVWVDRYRYQRYQIFSWRHSLSTAQKLGLALAVASLTGLMAQLRFYLPFTPVPVTGQVFAVLLSGVVLGKWYGGVSQGLYVGLGAAGLPWFAVWSGGIGVISGPTGGYLIGFILAASLIGWFTERYVGARSFLPQLGLMVIAVALIYGLGAAWFSILFSDGFTAIMKMAVLPFIPLDIIKAVAVAGITCAILPKEAYDGEVDRRKHPPVYQG
jgi:biotin transport system substrate-specific component